ncbi:MAG: VTT domain-containing protein [Vicinamibacterales bacterium]
MDWIAGLAGPMGIDARTWWTAVGSALAIGLLLGAIPVGATEAIALAAGALPNPLRGGVIVALTAGHVAGKVLWYWFGTLGSRVRQPRLRTWIERAQAVADRHPKVGLGVTTMSAVASVPPFHLIAVAAGIVRTPPAAFFAVAFAGRLVRFSALAAFPSLLRYLYT